MMPNTLEGEILLTQLKTHAPELKKALVFLYSLALKNRDTEIPCCPTALFALYCYIDELT